MVGHPNLPPGVIQETIDRAYYGPKCRRCGDRGRHGPGCPNAPRQYEPPVEPPDQQGDPTPETDGIPPGAKPAETDILTDTDSEPSNHD